MSSTRFFTVYLFLNIWVDFNFLKKTILTKNTNFIDLYCIYAPIYAPTLYTKPCIPNTLYTIPCIPNTLYTKPCTLYPVHYTLYINQSPTRVSHKHLFIYHEIRPIPKTIMYIHIFYFSFSNKNLTNLTRKYKFYIIFYTCTLHTCTLNTHP